MRHLILIIFILTLVSPAYAGQVHERKDHQKWSSMLIESDNHVFVGRLASLFGEDESFMAVDLFPGRCNAADVQLVLPYKKAKPQEPEYLKGAVRVDEMEIYDVNLRLTSTNGAYFLTLESYDKNLLFDAAKGNLIRFKVEAASKTLYFRFPLQGFTAAWRRASILCAASEQLLEENKDENYTHRPKSQKPPRQPKEHPDQHLFEQAPKKKSDVEYF